MSLPGSSGYAFCAESGWASGICSSRSLVKVFSNQPVQDFLASMTDVFRAENGTGCRSLEMASRRPPVCTEARHPATRQQRTRFLRGKRRCPSGHESARSSPGTSSAFATNEDGARKHWRSRRPCIEHSWHMSKGWPETSRSTTSSVWLRRWACLSRRCC